MEFRLPELGEGVTEGELVKWNVKVGDTVKDDQSLCEVLTDKATIEIPSPFSGVIKSIDAPEGTVVKVHQLMLTADTGGKAAAPQVAAAAPAPAKGQAPQTSAPAALSMTPPAQVSAPTAAKTNAADVLASPSTRKFARESGIDLGNVQASGPHGRVLRDDVEKATAGGAASASVSASAPARKAYVAGAADERVPVRGMRKKISEKMRESKDKAAHFTYVEEADATELVKLRTQAKIIAEKRGIKLTYLPFVLKAMVAALKQHPRINSTFDEATNELVIHHTFNISLSVQTEDGLTVPVLKHVEQKSIFELASEIADIVDRARKKKLTLADFQGSTITLTNAGSIGGLFATPIINYPEVAILGFNKIDRKAVVKKINGKEEIVIRDWTYFCISLNHRLIDGAEAAEFMKTFISYIEMPSLLVME
ncbi:MAG: 2-oxo acid dehydrogenase subunit E2 [Bdellovibrionales bacterium]|nr:2-oxo acid dehydrogenase subunit E2 [Oligoflexia bacterium]